ncbi:MAG: ATP-binding domain-containing protein [Chloroflexi bacterium]|nr:ATP-binding domain-containing protein [Chloroflexota bacterium]
MATMIPEKPIHIPEGSYEGEMFEALASLPDEYYVFHSFMIVSTSSGTVHESETDFIIFHPQQGMLVIEAKAGNVRCVQGVWLYASGREMKNGGPYRQADMNKWKLSKLFDKRGMTDVWKRCKVLHAVWFPSIHRGTLNAFSLPADSDKSLTLTKEALYNTRKEIDRIFDIELANGNTTHLSPADAKRILSNILCPTFDLVPAFATELGIKRSAFNRLLKEQANVLNFLEEQPYAIINGVAGTGKTMIALEKARRHAEQNEKVLFLCFNRKLCDHIKLQHPHTNISYYTIDAMACAWCNTTTADFAAFQEKLEIAYYEGHFPYQHIIIDEGQDFGQERIAESNIIGTLETIILDGQEGTFYLFYDKNQMVQGRRIPSYIADADCKLTLYKNCRNTENIAITSMRPLQSNAAPKMFEGSVKGDPPKLYFVDNAHGYTATVNAAIKECISTGIVDIVILTCETEERSALSSLCTNGVYRYYNQSIPFTSCRKFKGLEADAVILVDITKSTFEAENSLLFYVGASRARFFLGLVCDLSDAECNEVTASLGKDTRKKPQKNLAAALNSLLEMKGDLLF